MPVAFHFRVSISGFGNTADSSFQEVSGITQKMEVQDLKEGGENRFQHKLPTGIKQQNLTLKRGIADNQSPLMKWCKTVLEGGLEVPISPRSVRISLCDANRDPVRVWVFHNAFPVSWSVDPFNSTKNDVAIETIELAYLYAERMQ
ncbi:hypothetical protein GCM10027296_24720 [Chitinimonas naiadis]